MTVPPDPPMAIPTYSGENSSHSPPDETPNPTTQPNQPTQPHQPPPPPVPPVLVAEPVDVTQEEQLCILQVVNYRKTLMCMAMLDTVFTMFNTLVNPYYLLSLVLILAGYHGARNYSIPLSRLYVFYNGCSSFIKFLLLMFLINGSGHMNNSTNTTIPPDPYDNPSDSTYDTDTHTDIDTDTDTDSNKSSLGKVVPFWAYIYAIIDTLVTVWITRVGIRFTNALEFLEQHSTIYNRFRSGDYQVITNRSWQREYLW